MRLTCSSCQLPTRQSTFTASADNSRWLRASLDDTTRNHLCDPEKCKDDLYAFHNRRGRVFVIFASYPNKPFSYNSGFSITSVVIWCKTCFRLLSPLGSLTRSKLGRPLKCLYRTLCSFSVVIWSAEIQKTSLKVFVVFCRKLSLKNCCAVTRTYCALLLYKMWRP